LKEFDKPIPQASLNIVEKTRSNLFAWRGQFSPQLIEVILDAYCLPNSVILDPFVGSGTVLREAGTFIFEAHGFEINPAAWILSRTSEIGSNRANRGNRFYTVVQYCLDMADTLRELSRVTKDDARIVFVVGHESNVLGVPFYNADIIEKIGVRTGLFSRVLRQKREFRNKFGKIIREDLINFRNLNNNCHKETAEKIAREVAFDVLRSGLYSVSSKNIEYLEDAIDKVQDIGRTLTLDKRCHIYQHQPHQAVHIASPTPSTST